MKTINIDVDDTLVDFIGYAKNTWLPNNWGLHNLPDPACYNLAQAGWFSSNEEMQAFLREFAFAGGYEELKLLDPEAATVIRSLQKDGYKVRIVTVRGTQGDLDRQSIERESTILSLLNHGIDPDDWVFTQNKSAHPATLSVDDSTGHYEKYIKAGMNVALMDSPHNQSLITKDRVHNWTEVAQRARIIATP